MIGRASSSLVLSIWLIVLAVTGPTDAERWSRQVSNSEWIPLANPRSQQQGHHQNLAPPPLPQIHQPLIPGSLPPELRQEYQQQLLQLQKTQESIQRLLLLQQQLKQQQQLLQGQAYLPNGIAESEENKQSLHQSAIANVQTLPELAPEVLVPPQLGGEARPPVYSSQNFREPQSEIAQEQYEDYAERQPDDYRNSERPRESQREKEKYVPEAPSGAESAGESGGGDGEEEIQVVYVPAETLAQRGQSKNHQRHRDRKQYGKQDSRAQHSYANQRGQESQEPRERDNHPTTVSPEDDAYAREFLQQLQREHEGTDRLLKEARQKELDRLREERKEIQRQAKLQQAALEREQEIERQRDAEKKRKELAKLEEAAKQRELERIRASRERQRLEEVERSKKAQARANEEKRKQEVARQAEIERLATLERQKKAEIERTIAAQKELERVQKEEAERANQRKESSRPSEVSPQAQPLVTNQHNHQQHQHSGKYNRHSRVRTKPRQRTQTLANQNIEQFDHSSHETTTSAPLSPNQPPLAVYMSHAGLDSRVIRISDVLKTLKNAKTIDVLDNVGQDAPNVFVGPSNLEVPSGYAKFDLPYLSSIDNNRVERRVDKLPFFVAPLSFNPPPGYSKIPFPAPHIGSVVVNTLDSHIQPLQDGSLDEAEKPDLNPLIEPNAFIDGSNQDGSYSTTYDSPTTPTYANYRQEEPSSTPQYQSTPSYSTVQSSGPGSRFRFRQHFASELPSSAGSQDQSQRQNFQEQSQPRPTFQEESNQRPPNHSPRYSDESSGSTTPAYKRPSVVNSFSYQEDPQTVSSTPVYQESYSHVRENSPNRQSQHREVVQRYQLQDQRDTARGPEYSTGQIDSAANYEDSLRGPTQYNLPAELPPIIPQLPGLVNSLSEDAGQVAYRQPTTTTTTSTTTTTTEAPTTTVRSRGRHRGRLVATRPSTTSTTTPSPPGKSRDERTRRPFGRSRSRYVMTTEEYRDTYEPTKSKVALTTQRSYTSHETHKRPSSTKNQRHKSRDEENSHSSRNQVHDVQAHEASGSERNPSLDPNARVPEADGLGSNEPVYSQYNYDSSTVGVDNYPAQESDQSRIEDSVPGVDYSKALSYQQVRLSSPEDSSHRDEQLSQQYQERFPGGDYSRASLEDSPVNGFNYQVKSGSTAPPTPLDFSFYQNKQGVFEGPHGPATETPANSQANDYQRPAYYENGEEVPRVSNEDLTRPRDHFPVDNEKNSHFGTNEGPIYDPFAGDHQESFGTGGSLPEQAPLELTTEPPTTTTTTTEAPVIIRQRVRGRLGGRGRPDSAVQTRPGGSQNEYVRFNSMNSQNAPTTERTTARHREGTRSRPKTRPQPNGAHVQTEGNEYVRIQAPIRSYQKTIVTPPSTTHRPTITTPATTTTTVEYESNDDIEYGFIRPPNFNPIHPVHPANPVENRYHNGFRPADNQAQLQSVLPVDETAEDSSLSHAQVPRNRPKYQSPNRRTTSKAISSTTLTADTSPYTEKPRTRVEEPKNNRIRVRGRKPGRRRTTTTTTTTTEYVLEENNDLPLEENYPRPVEAVQDPERQAYYDEKFEALPLASGAAGDPVQQHQQQHGEAAFSGQDFLLSFGPEPGSLDADQTQLASNPPRKYGQANGSRLRANTPRRGSQDRDIYGAESQWSTKLTSTSFQPSPSANRLPQDTNKNNNFGENERYKYSNDEASGDAPEIITAAPEDSYVTVLVSSDDQESKSASASDEASMEAASMEGTNFGMKTNPVLANTTPTSTIQETFLPNSSTGFTGSSETAINGETEIFKETSPEPRPTRRMVGRRRRVRVRVRPAPIDDFVTAESQHINSAVNSLVQDRFKFNRLAEESRELQTTTQSTIQQEKLIAEPDEKTMLDDFFEEIFKTDNKSSPDSETTASNRSEPVTTAATSETPRATESQETTTNYRTNYETTVNDAEDNSKTTDPSSTEVPTNAPLMTTMTIPRKSWDSTKRYIDSIAMHSGEYLTGKKSTQETSDSDENMTGHGNEVFEKDYRENIAKTVDDPEGDNYPKNHRSQWSEVRYPTDRGLSNHNRRVKSNSSTTQLPGVVTKSDGETTVKTLSDYVKAIFDTMKNADEQKNDNEQITDGTSGAAESVSTTPDSTSTTGEVENTSSTVLPTEYSTTPEVPTTNSVIEKLESFFNGNEADGKRNGEGGLGAFLDENEASGKKNGAERFDDRMKISSGIEAETQRANIAETVGTRNDIDGSTEISTETDAASSTPSLDTETPVASSAAPLTGENSISSEAIDTTTTTTGTTPISVNSNPTKLGAILRTSTTTKVSHMTEICYRGRCVMTKPKKEIQER